MNISIMMLWWNYLLTMVVCRVPLSFLFFANTHLAFSCMLCSWNENKIHCRIKKYVKLYFTLVEKKTARPASKTSQQEWLARPASKTGQQEWPARPASKNGQQDWPAGPASKDWPAGPASRIGQQDWPAGLASKDRPAKTGQQRLASKTIINSSFKLENWHLGVFSKIISNG